MKMTSSALLVVLGFSLTACQPSLSAEPEEKISVAGGSFTNISAEGLHAMLKAKDFLFVNVHIPFEGDISGTDVSIPYDQITEPANLALLPANKEDKIVLYCRSDRMSTIAAEELVKLGYTDVWNLDGGMVEWEQAGYPLEGN
jgi:rhodanese-related sulfurtransferase